MRPKSRRGCINESNLVKKVWLTWRDNKSYDSARDIKVEARWADENRQVPKSIWKAFFSTGENPAIYFPAYHSMGQKLCIKFGAQRPALSNNCTYCRDGQGGGGRGKLSKAQHSLEKKIWDFLSKINQPHESHLSYCWGGMYTKMPFSNVHDCFLLERGFLCFWVHWVVVTIRGDETTWPTESIPTWGSKTRIFRITSETKLWKLSLKLLSCLPNTSRARGLTQQPSRPSAEVMLFGWGPYRW